MRTISYTPEATELQSATITHKKPVPGLNPGAGFRGMLPLSEASNIPN